MKAPNLTLSQRLFLLTAFALLPALAILGFNEWSLRRAREAEVHSHAAQVSELAALELSRILTGAAALMIAVGNAPVAQDRSGEGCADYLARMQASLPQLDLLRITDAQGRVSCSSDRQQGNMDEEGAQLRADLASRPFAVGTYTETAQGPGLPVGARIIDPGGTDAPSFVTAVISLRYLGQLVAERSFEQGRALVVADRNGIILAREPFPERFVGTRIPDSFMPLVQGTSPGTQEITSQDGTRRVIGYQPATPPLGLYVSAGTAVDDAFAPINQSTLRGVGLALSGSVLATVLAWSFGRSFIRRPVQRLVDTIRTWRTGDHTARTGMGPGSAEFDQVGHAIDAMLDEIDERQAAQSRAEQHRDLLARELDHRVKNLLATVQALARQTFREGDVSGTALRVFNERLGVMGDAHRLLTEGDVEGADMACAIGTAIAPFEGRNRSRFDIAGPALFLRPKATLSLSMALHELCTNAVKYGALANENGRVSIVWTGREDEHLTLTWTETGGPPVSPPSRQGFGSRMIERALAADLGARVSFNYAPDGLVCTIQAERSTMVGERPTAPPAVGKSPAHAAPATAHPA